MEVETWCAVGTLLSASTENRDELNLGLGEYMGTGVRKTLSLLQPYLIDIINLNEIISRESLDMENAYNLFT